MFLNRSCSRSHNTHINRKQVHGKLDWITIMMDDRDIKDKLNVTTGQEEGDDELTPTNTLPTLESGSSSFADSEASPATPTKSEAPTSPRQTLKKGIFGLFTPLETEQKRQAQQQVGRSWKWNCQQ